MATTTLMIIGFVLFVALFQAVRIVPQQELWILERLGKFDRKMEAGLNFIIPFIERVAYKHSMKEQVINVAEQTAISKDNVTLRIDGVIYVRITDPVSASYGVSEPYYAISQLAQTTMRSEIGKMTMDRTFEERELMNANIIQTINEASNAWGIQCMRYELKDISPPQNVIKAMELQVAAERQKRAEILESEGKKQSQINLAEGYKQEIVLRSEAAYTDQVNRARGEAEGVLLVAESAAKSLDIVALSLNNKGGEEAASLKIAQSYIEAFKQLAKEGNTIIVPATISDVGGMIAQAMTIFSKVKDQTTLVKGTVANPWNELK
jgi:regulator of protease activity HflC (stomatin/prohibitin superfamily)